MRAKIQVMKKRVFLIAHVDEGCVKAGHKLFDLSDINVTDGIGKVAALLLQGYEPAFFKKGYRHLLGLHIDDEFAFH